MTLKRVLRALLAPKLSSSHFPDAIARPCMAPATHMPEYTPEGEGEGEGDSRGEGAREGEDEDESERPCFVFLVPSPSTQLPVH